VLAEGAQVLTRIDTHSARAAMSTVSMWDEEGTGGGEGGGWWWWRRYQTTLSVDSVELRMGSATRLPILVSP